MQIRHRPGTALRVLLVALLATTAAAAGAHGASARAPARPSGAGPPGTLRMGAVTLRPCTEAWLTPAYWCGRISVPFSYSDPADGWFRVGFALLPAGRGPTRSTIVAEEGGPGYPSSGSASLYRALFRPLLRTHNLLLVDARGTGLSGVIDCPRLQGFPAAFASPTVAPEPSPAFGAAVARCGRSLDHVRPLAGGSFVHGADLYDTANDARDMAAVLTALGTGPVDFYGDSYGSFFGQALASRYPGLLRSVTLDSTYPALGPADYFARSSLEAARTAFDRVCALAVACAAAAPGPSWRRIVALVNEVRTHPVRGFTTDARGHRVAALVDTTTLVDLVNDAGFDPTYDPLVYRELDAAARALLGSHDAAPLLHLAVLDTELENGGVSADPEDYSDGLYFAATCTDYSAPWHERAPVAVHRAELAHRIAALPPGDFAPFTVAEWLRLDAYDQALTSCVGWPPLAGYRAPVVAHGAPLVPPTLPVLVLDGTLDSLTPAAGGQQVARQLGPSARFVLLANTTHVAGEDDFYGCATSIIRAFVADPAALWRLDTSCATTIPAVRAVGSFPDALARAAPATPGPGDAAGPTGLRLAAVAAATVGDAIADVPFLHGGRGGGLRGGGFTYAGFPVVRIGLTSDRFVADVAVDGTANWDRDTGTVTAAVTTKGPGRLRGSFRLSWDGFTDAAVATVTGSAGGVAVAATLPAP